MVGDWMYRRSARIALLLGLCLAAGCQIAAHPPHHTPLNVIPPQAEMPRELAKTTLPPYTIEPPDILVIDALKVIPKPPYRVDTLDVLLVQATNVLPEAPLAGAFTVEPGGIINLGIPYGVVQVTGLTLDEVAARLTEHLARFARDPEVSVTLGQLAGQQQVAGQHLVAIDGTVTLGAYGSVYVAGLTLAQAKGAIEAHLSLFLEDPEVAVDVFAYNSKVYYVITQGAGLGDGVTRFPSTGNETVLDAISQINGLTSVSSKRIWIARPTPGMDHDQILPVDWHAVTARGSSATNYQILPGDRVFVAEDKLIALDTGLGKILAPAERLFGFTALGNSVIRSLQIGQRGGGGFGGFGGVGF